MSLYLTSLRIPSRESFFDAIKKQLEDNLEGNKEKLITMMPFYYNGPENYPLWLFPQALSFEFAPITIFNGGNGCGKSTILNLIAAKLGIGHRSASNTSEYFNMF
ncbi:MAG: hypothetical protein J6866_05350, partial [Victivallales bacterium]|nr:hypothetical protein [Victivallales bacterium]